MAISRFSAVTMLAVVFGAGSTSLALADVVINIDKSTQRMSVAVDGFQRWQWPVSSGMRGRDTPSGAFKAFRMEKEHFSKEWDDAPMPNSIFFTMKGHAIHGSFDRKHLGQPVSHGCVRLAPENAALLFDLVKKEGMAHTQVVLSGEADEPSSYGPNGREPNFLEALFGPHPDQQPVEAFATAEPRRARNSKRHRNRE